jgi:phage baseplate assembly protein W
MNNEFDIIGTSLIDVEIGAKGLNSILQNVRTIITTWRGSVFLDRQFGFNTRIIDMPINLMYPNLIVDLTEQINKYEPRAEVVGINFQESDAVQGQMIPLVRIRIREEVLL